MNTYDTIIIGGGPAGMMAAIQAVIMATKHYLSKKINDSAKN